MRRTIPVFPLVFAAACLCFAAGALGCSSDSAPVKTCTGWEDPSTKQCYKLCDETKCAANNYCFKDVADDGTGALVAVAGPGFCAPPCASKNDCGYGYGCVAAEAMVPDSTSATMYCKSLGLAGNGAPGVACTSDAGCDTSTGLACLGGICSWQCKSINNCPDGYECKGNPTPPSGALPGFCSPRKSSDFLPGRYGTVCASGKDDACDTAAGFMCSGELGSCTKTDGCTADADCPSGYWCGTKSAMQSDDKNIDYSKYHMCIERDFCAPCANDIDCSFTIGAVCVPDTNGEKFCSSPCEKDTNACIIGATCADTGGGVFACRPDVGVCHDKNPQGCSPCRVDSDCGPESLCRDAQTNLRKGMKWCMTPCGPADSFGKATCPVAPNGLEMMCLDENETSLGGPFSSTDPNYQYKHCYAPYTVENTEKYPGYDPPNNICGNYIRDPDEECDDGNSVTTDGCDNCKITAACTFAIQEDKNGDVWTGDATVGPVLQNPPNQIPTAGNDPMTPYFINTEGSKGCKAFKVTGSIEAAGDVDTFAFVLGNGGFVWLDSFAGGLDKCDADLKIEDRAWGDNYQTAALNLLDKNVGCADLSGLQQDFCDTKQTTLGCGSCTTAGLCGSCDDDNGIGDCNHMLISTNTKYENYYPVVNDGKVRLVRIYARDPSATVASYEIIVNRFVPQSEMGTATPTAIMCN